MSTRSGTGAGVQRRLDPRPSRRLPQRSSALDSGGATVRGHPRPWSGRRRLPSLGGRSMGHLHGYRALIIEVSRPRKWVACQGAIVHSAPDLDATHARIRNGVPVTSSCYCARSSTSAPSPPPLSSPAAWRNGSPTEKSLIDELKAAAAGHQGRGRRGVGILRHAASKPGSSSIYRADSGVEALLVLRPQATSRRPARAARRRDRGHRRRRARLRLPRRVHRAWRSTATESISALARDLRARPRSPERARDRRLARAPLHGATRCATSQPASRVRS